MVVVRFIFLVSILFLTACATFFDRAPRAVKNTFNYEKINGFSGIYAIKPTDTLGHNIFFIFYQDGTFASNIEQDYLDYYNLNSVEDLLLKSESKKDIEYRLNRNFSWGYYEINNDSITMFRIYKRHYGSAYWFAYKHDYVLDSLILKCVASKDIAPFKERDKSYEEQLDQNPSMKHHQIEFIDSCNCTTSDTWLKYEKWFWKHEQDYKDWIEKSGGDRKKYRK